MNFSYLAVDRGGQVHRGERSAGDAASLAALLRHDGLELLRARPRRAGAAGIRLTRRELMQLCFELDLLFRSGIPLLDGLRDLGASAPPGRQQALLADLSRGITQGELLSQAMARHPRAFPPLVSQLVAAGEASGQLARTLGLIGEHLRWQDELASQTGKALIYPAIVLIVVGGVGVFLLLFLVPQLRQFATQMHAVPTTASRLLFASADLLRQHWPWLPPLLLAPGALLVLVRRLPAGRLYVDRLLWQLPGPGRLYRALALSRLSSTLGLLYDAGLPILDSLRLTRQVVDNRALDRAIGETEAAIHAGQSLAQALAATRILPPLPLRLLSVGEQSGRLGEALHEIARLHQREGRDGIARLQTLIEPTLTLVLGLFLGWLMMAVLGPIYDIIGRLKP